MCDKAAVALGGGVQNSVRFIEQWGFEVFWSGLGDGYKWL
jgi:hypothetical protein